VAWDFRTDPEYQDKLDWAATFVEAKVAPLDLALPHLQYQPLTPERRSVVLPLKQAVRDHGLWACHLGPDLGGQGYGQLKLGLLNEILGQSSWAPIIFGCQAPDTGNAEIIAHYGTDEQKAKYLQPLLDGELFSCYSMTEPHAGADPTEFTTTARKDGDEWVIDGWKFFSSNAKTAEFFIVMAYTDRDQGPYRGMSMFIVPSDADGLTIERNFALFNEASGEGSHALVHYDGVRVPAENLLGGEGQAFAVAQTRLGGGRVHHAMRTVGVAKRALDMMCERALSRTTKGQVLARKQMVQGMIADSFIDLQQFRLLVLYTAWLIDETKDYMKVRKDIAAIKVMTPRVLEGIARRAIQVHGALGLTRDMPLGGMLVGGIALGLADGPTEVHQQTVAKELLKLYQPAEGMWPSAYLPPRREAAEAALAELVDLEVGSM
jgi:acyl-CoA dehydrogenase